MHQKNDLQKAINDIKIINAGYQDKDNSSSLLCEKLKRLEMELLDQFYVLMNKPAVRKAPAKRAKDKSMNEKASGTEQI